MTARLLSSDGPGLQQHLAAHGSLPSAALGDRRLLTQIEASGLLGHGGAGFPLHRKITAVSNSSKACSVVGNGMEGEPASFKDLTLMTQAPHLVLDGLQVAAGQVGATHIVLALHRDSAAESAMRTAISEREDSVSVTLRLGPSRYVSSEESALVHWINGGEGRPTFTPPRPYEQGVDGKPTLVSNVETLAHLALVARHGANWFCSVGHPSEPGTRLLTVDGRVVEVPTDTRVGDLIGTPALLIGGYFGNWHKLQDVAQAPVTQDGLRQAGGALGAGVLASLPAGICPLSETARIADYLAGQSARQCGPCFNGLPAIAAVVGKLAFGGWNELMAPELNRWMALVPGRGACRHPDGSVRFVISALATFAEHADHHRRHGPCANAFQAALLPIPGPVAVDAGWR